MKNCIIIPFPGNQNLTNRLADKLKIEIGVLEIHDFPDGESYIRVDADVKDKIVILIGGLDHPNNKILPLIFTANTIKELGANKLCLVSPYLPYMRQDKRFKPGEAVTSLLFANVISATIDNLITIDPHLHRIKNLADIYSIDSVSVLHSTKLIAEWISNNVDSPLIIGPDEESQQWVEEVAGFVSAPYSIIKKHRYGDREVSIALPDINGKTKTPVIVDDIISTGTSMLAVTRQLIANGFKKPICIAVHALFDKDTYNDLLKAGVHNIVTCNTIPNSTNKIDITKLISDELIHLNYIN